MYMVYKRITTIIMYARARMLQREALHLEKEEKEKEGLHNRVY